MSPEPPPTRSPRPGRTARWLIGLGVAAALAVTSFTFLVIGLAGLDHTDPARLDGTATATVLDVDTYLEHDYDDDASISVDVAFTYQGEREVTVMDWPSYRSEPAEGDKVRVRFDTTDPEYTVELDDDQPGDVAGGTGSGTVAYRAPPSAAAAPVAATGPGAGSDGRDEFLWAWWVAAGCALASVLTVAATAVWASRVPNPPRPLPYYGQYPLTPAPHGQPGYGPFPPNLPPYVPPTPGAHPPPS